MRKSTRLHRRLDEDGISVLPGAYDTLSAKLIEQAGFEQFFTTGFGLAASTLGVPDIGILTQTEIIERARRINGAVSIPLVADMDTGYGNPVNAIRTVTECVQGDIAAIILEDQDWPKRCGRLKGKRVIPVEDHVQKLRAAVHARDSDDLISPARMPARSSVWTTRFSVGAPIGMPAPTWCSLRRLAHWTRSVRFATPLRPMCRCSRT